MVKLILLQLYFFAEFANKLSAERHTLSQESVEITAMSDRRFLKLSVSSLKPPNAGVRGAGYRDHSNDFLGNRCLKKFILGGFLLEWLSNLICFRTNVIYQV